MMYLVDYDTSVVRTVVAGYDGTVATAIAFALAEQPRGNAAADAQAQANARVPIGEPQESHPGVPPN